MARVLGRSEHPLALFGKPSAANLPLLSQSLRNTTQVIRNDCLVQVFTQQRWVYQFLGPAYALNVTKPEVTIEAASKVRTLGGLMVFTVDVHGRRLREYDRAQHNVAIKVEWASNKMVCVVDAMRSCGERRAQCGGSKTCASRAFRSFVACICACDVTSRCLLMERADLDERRLQGRSTAC